MKSLYLCDNTKVTNIAAVCRELHFGIEVQSFYDPLYCEKHPDAIQTHRHCLDGIEHRALHGPFGDLVPGSFDPLVREVCRDRFELAVEIASQLDVRHIILHHGFVPNTGNPDRWIERAASLWQAFLGDKNLELNFHLENVFEHDIDMLSRTVASIGDWRVDVCLDIGHAHCFSGRPVTEWIEQLGDTIGYVHLHNNDGRRDQHKGLTDGTIDMHKVCAALNEHAPDAIWALEPEEGMTESIAWLQANDFV